MVTVHRPHDAGFPYETHAPIAGTVLRGTRMSVPVFILCGLLANGCRTGAPSWNATAVPPQPEILVGENDVSTGHPSHAPDLEQVPSNATRATIVRQEPTTRLVAHSEAIQEELPAPDAHSILAMQSALEVDSLVREVLNRNPNISSLVAAWQAAAERFPQEISLEDPMFGFMLGPGSWGSNEVGFAYTLETSQKIPWPGKRRLRGEIARVRSSAASLDVDEEKLRIAELAQVAYYEYYLAHRRLAVLKESTELLEALREVAEAKYRAGEVQQQDVLLADVELGRLERRHLEQERAERISRARINTLLLALPNDPLPAPPVELPASGPLPGSRELLEQSLALRPGLSAQAARIRAEGLSARLACKEFFPDMEFVARYDAFWQEIPLRPMVGMFINVPVHKARRHAAVREAEARMEEQQAILEAQFLDLAFEIEQSYQRVEESHKALNVYRDRIVPASRQSVESARASYVAGRLDFLRLVESQQRLLSVQDELYSAIAEYHQRLAELNRQVGGPPLGTLPSMEVGQADALAPAERPGAAAPAEVISAPEKSASPPGGATDPS